MSTRKQTAKRPAAKRTTARKPAARKATARKATATKAARRSAAKRAPARGADRYTKPELRERLKARILRGTKGGEAGQWSARKAQLLAHAYEAAGGGYKGGKSTAQRHLQAWTRTEQAASAPTKVGSARRRGTTSR